MLYLLPTRGTTRYTGKHPNRIRSFGSSGADKDKDKDGARCAHWETNSGERYTCSYDRLEMGRLNRTRSTLGTIWTEFVRNGTVVTTMPQADYDVWLASVRAERELARCLDPNS